MPPDNEAAHPRGLLRRLTASLRLVLAGGCSLIALTAFLVFLVGRAADERNRALLAEEFDRTALALADALRPILRAATPGDVAVIAEAMDPYASADRTLYLFFTPANGGASGVFFITGAPAIVAARTEGEAERAVASGTLGDFSASCAPTRTSALSAAGTYWAAVPLASPSGCWRLVASRPVRSMAIPYFSLPPLRSAALGAAAAALLMLAAAILALTQTRRLRSFAEVGHAFAEITAVPDPALLPLPANDGSAIDDPPEASPETAQVLTLTRSIVDLSSVVRAHTDTVATTLATDADRLRADIADGLLIEGRADFVRTILEELVEPALRAPSTREPIVVTLSGDDLGGRGFAMLTVETPPGAAGDEAAGRLSHIKQFIAALGAAVTTEMCGGGRLRVLLRLPLARGVQTVRSDAS
ncbi:MAG: hypothetical protein AB7E79_01975 [Rhodospirillaceae bacterium]